MPLPITREIEPAPNSFKMDPQYSHRAGFSYRAATVSEWSDAKFRSPLLVPSRGLVKFIAAPVLCQEN